MIRLTGARPLVHRPMAYSRLVTPAQTLRRPSLIVAAAPPPAVEFSHVSMSFGDHVVLPDLSFSVPKGAMRIVLGASGAGKSVMLKLILGLLKPDAGTIAVNGERIDHLSERDLLRVRKDIGMVFQDNALFDSLTVAENVGYPMDEAREMSAAQVRARVAEVLGFIGLTEFADRLPSELSGGQRRRVAIARAMAPKPSLVLFDDPITGLDPIIAMAVDDEIIKLRDLEGMTSMLVTHQIRDAVYIATHEALRTNDGVTIVPATPRKAASVEFMLLHDGTIRFQGRAEEIFACPDPYVQEYLYKTTPPW